MDSFRERGMMGRLRRFQEHRFVGTRDTMRVYDCDDTTHFEAIEARVDELEGQNLFQTFGPDTLAEARNRGFTPPRFP